MAYFPNGSAGMNYMESYCSDCQNWRDTQNIGTPGCFVMDLHSPWNYDACNGKDAPKGSVKHTQWVALEHFIPTTKDGLYADQCKMYLPKDGVEVVDMTEKLKEWEAVYGKRTD